MNHGAQAGLCAPASYVEENTELRRELQELQLRSIPWYRRLWAWCKKRFA